MKSINYEKKKNIFKVCVSKFKISYKKTKEVVQEQIVSASLAIVR